MSIHHSSWVWGMSPKLRCITRLVHTLVHLEVPNNAHGCPDTGHHEKSVPLQPAQQARTLDLHSCL